MTMELVSLLLLAFGLGLLHALDADHVIAVSGLSCRKQQSSLLFCARWALGHGGALLLIGVAVLFLGMAIPETLSAYAEMAVGAVLIIIGVFVFWDVIRQRAHLHFHSHDGIEHHAHWHSHQHTEEKHADDAHHHNHAPLFVGLLHGVAGSAPLLALLPLTQMSPWAGVSYLLLFGLGVFIAMLIFGGLLKHLFNGLTRWGNPLINGIRVMVSLISIAYGGFLLVNLS